MSTEGIEAPRKSTNPGIHIYTGGPSEFDLLIDTMKREMQDKILVALFEDPRPLASILLCTRETRGASFFLVTDKIMTSPTDIKHEAVVTLTVEFREKAYPDVRT